MNVHYDQKNGIGSVPFNQDVDYRGFKCWMYPTMFLRLAKELTSKRESSVQYLKSSIEAGKSIGSPFLEVTWDESKEIWSVWSHEGRHRMEAIKQLWPNELVEVHIFCGGGLRARHINDQMVQKFMDGVFAESKTYVKNPCGIVELNGKIIKHQKTTPLNEEVKREYATDHGVQKVSFPHKNTAYLYGLYVNHHHRSKGEGKKLLNQVIGDADQSGTMLILHTRPDMINFFKKFGFEEHGKDHFGIIMIRKSKQKLNESKDAALRFINPYTKAQYLVTKDPLGGWRITIFREMETPVDYSPESANGMAPINHINFKDKDEALRYIRDHFPHLKEKPYNFVFEEGKRDNTLHMSWDYGAINSAMGDFGLFNFQNTAKTLCGKKVGIEKISNHHPTCPNCLKEKEESERTAIKMLNDLSPEEKADMLKKYPNIQKILDKYKINEGHRDENNQLHRFYNDPLKPGNVFIFHGTRHAVAIWKQGVKAFEPGVITKAGFKAVFASEDPAMAKNAVDYEEDLKSNHGYKLSKGSRMIVVASLPEKDLDVNIRNGQVKIYRNINPEELIAVFPEQYLSPVGYFKRGPLYIKPEYKEVVNKLLVKG
jgi:ribosomal protein S18 acetylase RimI-like enzyme